MRSSLRRRLLVLAILAAAAVIAALALSAVRHRKVSARDIPIPLGIDLWWQPNGASLLYTLPPEWRDRTGNKGAIDRGAIVKVSVESGGLEHARLLMEPPWGVPQHVVTEPGDQPKMLVFTLAEEAMHSGRGIFTCSLDGAKVRRRSDMLDITGLYPVSDGNVLYVAVVGDPVDDTPARFDCIKVLSVDMRTWHTREIAKLADAQIVEPLAVASSGRILYFVKWNRGAKVWQIMRRDLRASSETPVGNPCARYLGAPSLSPDGALLAFHRWTGKGRAYDLVLLHLQSGVESILAHDPYPTSRIAWSPDGSRITYISWTDRRPRILRVSEAGLPGPGG